MGTGKRSRQLGLTAFELLAGLALVALLASLAVPGFAGLRRAAGLGAAANELLWAVHLARSSAGLRGLPVTLCLTADGWSCLERPDGVASGWLVFQASGASVSVQPAAPESLLHSFRLPAEILVTGTRPAVTFWPVSRMGTTGTFALCDARGRAAGRSIVLSQSGRPRVATAEAAACER
jgi:type IV fimbrial biogenesis protein FimT